MMGNRFVTLTPRLALVCGVSLAGVASAWAQPATATASPSATTQSAADKVQALKASGASGSAITPQALGDFSRDTVYTSVTPCRIVDSRIAGGRLTTNNPRTYDVDGTTFSAQGGANASCGIPSGVASAVAMTITAVQPSGSGNFIAWGLGTQPNSSVVNFMAGQNVANTTIVPVVPGAGNDFSVVSTIDADVVIDVVGYFAAPLATALDCTNVSSGTVTVPVNQYFSVDAFCPAGYTVTGGGTFPTEGTLGRPNIWTDGSPISNGWRTWVDNQNSGTRTLQTYARCCRVPGR